MSIFSDIRKVDKLFELLLTRINGRYSKQKEMRIILGGRILEYLDVSQYGYKIVIPEDAVSKVYIFTDPKSSFCQGLKRIDYLKDKMEIIPNSLNIL